MKLIELRPAVVRARYADIDVIDNLEDGGDAADQGGGGRKRYTITVEYSEYDVKALLREGLDLDGALAHYQERITYIVKRYLLTDFEVRNGWDEVLGVIRANIEKYFR